MDNTANFNSQVITAVQEKIIWYDSVEMTKLLEGYRGFHSLVASLINVLEKKAVIKGDPYKHEKKISDIDIIADTAFSDADKSVVIGTRLSDLESMVDFICHYFKFSIMTLTVDHIKKLIGLNNSFLWTALTTTSPRPNTRGLAEIITGIRVGSDSLSISVVNDCISHLSKIVSEINVYLKEITDFQREVYKAEVRQKILTNSAYNSESVAQNPSGAVAYIKKLFPPHMGKKPFYAELIDEIVQEEYSPEKEQLRQALMSQLSTAQTTVKKVEQQIDPKELLLDALRILAAVAPQFEQIASRLEDNQAVLEAQQNNFSDKFFRLLRKVFGGKESPVEYRLTIFESVTQTKRTQIIVFQEFLADIVKRARTYATFAVKKTPGYQKLEAMTESQIAEYLVKQLAECQSLLILLNAVDAYCKANAESQNKSRIRGLKIELASIKNTLVKTNQCRADYSAFVEEQAQLKKLGITNA